MEVANADGFVFKRRRKEETSTSAHPVRQKAPRVEETHQNNNYHGPSVQEHVVEDVHQVRAKAERVRDVAERNAYPSISRPRAHFFLFLSCLLNVSFACLFLFSLSLFFLSGECWLRQQQHEGQEQKEDEFFHSGGNMFSSVPCGWSDHPSSGRRG